METCTKGNYDLNEVATALRKFERPAPGKGGGHMTGLSAYVEDDSMSQVASARFLSHPSGGETAVSLTYMTESLFLPPRSLDDELWMKLCSAPATQMWSL